MHKMEMSRKEKSIFLLLFGEIMDLFNNGNYKLEPCNENASMALRCSGKFTSRKVVEGKLFINVFCIPEVGFDISKSLQVMH